MGERLKFFNQYFGEDTYSAIIRFLPTKDDDLPIYTNKVHFVNNRYVKCKDEDCPICKKAKELYSNGSTEDMQEALRLRAKKQFFSNVYVMSDFINPENNDKVMRFKFGQQIYDKILEQLYVEVPEGFWANLWFSIKSLFINPITDIWDFFKGKNFYFIKKKIDDRYPTYTESHFAKARSRIADTEEKMEEIYEKITDFKDI